MRPYHWIVLFLALCAVVHLPLIAQEGGKNVLLIDDIRTIEKWQGGQIEHGTERGGTLKWTLTPGKSVEACQISLAPFKMNPTEYDHLKFEYRIDGACKWFGVKIQHFALLEGQQVVYKAYGPGDGTQGWQEAMFVVNQPDAVWENKSGGKPEVLSFRATCVKEGPCVIQMRNLRFTKSVVKTEARKVSESSTETRFEILLRNVDTAPHEADLTLDAAPLEAFSASLSAQHVRIEPGSSASVTVNLALAPNQKKPPLYCETAHMRVSVRNEPESAQELNLSATVPLPALSRPFVLATKEQIERAKEKVGKCEWARKIYDSLIKKADKLLESPNEIPDRTGSWEHYYSCPECGCKLKTLAPTQHKCTGCGKIYSGDPYDAVVITGLHHRWADNARDLGLAFAFTGNIEYARRSAQIFKEYAEKYQKYIPQDHRGNVGKGWRVTSTVLGEAVWAIPVAQAYDFIRDAGVLTEEEKRRIEDDFFRPIAKSIRGHRSIHNITCWRNAAVGSIGLAIGDQEMVRWAVEEPAGLKDQISQGILEDGFWFEGSWGYHFYALSPLCYLAESAQHVGIDVFNEQFEKMFTAPLHFMTTDGWLPAFNDSGRRSHVGYSWRYGLAALRYPKSQEIAWIVSKCLEEGKAKDIESLLFTPGEAASAGAPPMTTCLFKASGIVILRSPSPTDQIYVAFEYGPHGGGHGHPDKLGFVMCALGMELAPDPGSISYAVPLHRQWYRQTISHNTLTVDQESQKPTTGELCYLKSSPELQIASARTAEAYPGVNFQRTIAIIANDCVMVLDDVKSDKEHLYDIAFHIRGEIEANLDPQPAPIPIGRENGYEVLEQVKIGKGAKQIAADFNIKSEEPVGVRMLTLGADGCDVITALGRGNPPTERVPCVILRKKAKEARYLSILEPFRERAKVKNFSQYPVMGEDGAADSEAVGMTIEAEDWRACGIIASTKARRSCQGNRLEADAKAALVLWRGGEIKGAILVDGESLTADGKTVRVDQ